MMKRGKQELELESTIIDALVLAGLTVYHTTPRAATRATGVSRGVPDLLVALGKPHHCILIGIEVKLPSALDGKGGVKEAAWSSPEQRAAFYAGHFGVATSPLGALHCVEKALFDQFGELSMRVSSVIRALNGTPLIDMSIKKEEGNA